VAKPTKKLGELLSQGRVLLSEPDPVDAHRDFEEWVDDVAEWLESELASPALAAAWSELPYSELVTGAGYYDDPRAWSHFRSAISRRMTWLGQAVAAQQNVSRSSENPKEAAPTLSNEGRRMRFARWDELGLEAIKQDLTNGGHRLIGGPLQVRALGRKWVRMKENELAEQAALALAAEFARCGDVRSLRKNN
jgi:hypothetical protein